LGFIRIRIKQSGFEMLSGFRDEWRVWDERMKKWSEFQVVGATIWNKGEPTDRLMIIFNLYSPVSMRTSSNENEKILTNLSK